MFISSPLFFRCVLLFAQLWLLLAVAHQMCQFDLEPLINSSVLVLRYSAHSQPRQQLPIKQTSAGFSTETSRPQLPITYPHCTYKQPNPGGTVSASGSGGQQEQRRRGWQGSGRNTTYTTPQWSDQADQTQCSVIRIHPSHYYQVSEIFSLIPPSLSRPPPRRSNLGQRERQQAGGKVGRKVGRCMFQNDVP